MDHKVSFTTHRTVLTPKGKKTFVVEIHEVRPETLLIEADFYKQCGEVPEGSHQEIEIKSPALWDLPVETKDKIHFKVSSLNGRRFVCYPRPIPTTVELNRILGIWCLGTAWTLDTGKDFQELKELNGVSVEEAEQFMRNHFCICFIWTGSVL